MTLGRHTLSEDARRVYDRMVIAAVGKSKAVTPYRIYEFVFGKLELERAIDRVIRQKAYNIIRHIRKHWSVVCELHEGKQRSGYFIPATIGEVESWLSERWADYGARGQTLRQQTEMAKSMFPELNNQSEFNF